MTLRGIGGGAVVVTRGGRLGPTVRTQRAQYPLIKEYGLNYIGLHIMVQAIFLN